jgi:diguanylate cyclase (GGDEF)-like protein/PAS domain S-box-containing protein
MVAPNPPFNTSDNQYDDLDSVDAFVTGSTIQLNDHVVETYRAFLSAMPEGAATLSNDGIILHCNPKLLKMLGKSSSEIVGMPFHEWLTPQTQKRFNEMLKDQQVLVMDLELKCFGDDIVPVQLSANRLIVEGMSLVCLVVVDLTERRKLELERHKFVSLADNSEDFIAICDQNLSFHYINPRGLTMLGIDTLAQGIEIPLQELYFPEDRAFILEDFCPKVKAIGSAEIEIRFRHFKSDSAIWMLQNVFSIQDDQNNMIGYATISRDITARKYVEDRLRLTSKVFDNSLESVIITDANRDIIEVNNAFCKMTGYTREEVLGKNPRFLKANDQATKLYEEMWSSIDTYGYWTGEICNKRKTGETYVEWISISAVRDEKSILCYYVGIATDITVYKLHQKQLEHIAHFDVLTDIPNRVLLVDRLKQATAQAQREQKMLAVCYLDLDGFKPINDNLGHDAGDQVLILIAKRIQQVIRTTDTVARIGGDEFVVLLLGQEKLEECIQSLNRLLESIAKPIQIQEQYFIVTASIGVTLYPKDDADQDTLLRHADQAMYIAKQLGKNQYCLYDSTQEQKVKSRLETIQRIQDAIKNTEFVLYYQPKIELDTLRPFGVEALIRWQHPEQGLLAPGQFMHLIESADLEIQIGEFVIHESLKQANTWYANGMTIEMSINIAAKHLQSWDFVQKLQNVLNLYPALPRGILQIEVLETTALEDISRAQTIIQACRSIGVSFALDDFGTGYSTLAYLRNLPADTLKIDQTFVRDMLVDSGDLAIVQGIIALANTFNRNTVAEGVETIEHIDVLKKLGCQQGQGYGIARPMPADDLPKWLSNWDNAKRR